MWMPQVGIKHVHQGNYGFNICERLPTVSQILSTIVMQKWVSQGPCLQGPFIEYTTFIWDPGLCYLVFSGQINIF